MSAKPMDAPTLTALQGSIKKWEAVVSGTDEDDGAKNCPLCEVFQDEADEDPEGQRECFGCPVADKVGQIGCGGTPYIPWGAAVQAANATAAPNYTRHPWKATTPHLIALAQAELDFLKSLLPVAA